jgi:hypothetical protein
MNLYPGDPVVFFASWSTWRGMSGRVVRHSLPGIWVLIDGDAQPVAVSTSEVIRDESEHHMGGAE